MRRRIRGGVLVFALLVSCARPGDGSDPSPPARPAPPTPPPGGVLVRFENATVAAEVAATPEQRRRGLMERSELGSDAGMLFVFPDADYRSFWMRNTLIPLSIAYLARRGPRTYEVAQLLDMVPCRAEPCPRYRSAEPADAALEVNQGWFRRAGVEPGATAEVEGRLRPPR